MAEARLTAVVETRGAKRANDELTKLGRSSKKVETNVIRAEKRFKSFGKNAAAAIAAVDGPLGGISSRVSALTTVLTSGTAAMTVFAAAIVGAGVVLIQGVGKLDEYNVNLKRVNATIKATGEGVGVTGEALRAEAESLALATLTSVDAVQKAQAKLLTFNRVLGDEFTRSIKLSQDLAEAGFGSIETNAILLGKALQDPIKGMSALSRVGVTLSETQKQLARDAVNVGDVFAAQGIILDAIAGQVEGVGKAVADGTLAGAVDTLGQNWDTLTRNVAESSGALSVWTQIVRGAGIEAEKLANAFAPESSDDLFAIALESSLALADAESKLNETIKIRGAAYSEQIRLVNQLRNENEKAVKAASDAAEIENTRIKATGEALKKERDARARITAEVKAEADAKAKTEKDKADKKLETQKANAQKELQTILALNNSELQVIDAKESARLSKAKLSLDQMLINEQEFQAAKAAIELNASDSRQLLLDTEAEKNKERILKENELLSSSIGSLSSELVGAALSGESLGDAVSSSILDISKSIIKAGVDQLIQEQIINRINTAAFVQAKTAEVTATSAQAAQNAFAATSAIPVVGPALAPAAAVAAGTAAASIGSTVISAAAAREQGGSLSAGKSATIAERGQLEILTPSSSSRIRTASQMKQLMGENNSAPTINIVNIDQSSGGVSIDSSIDDEGRIIQIVRDTTALDAVNPNSQMRKSFASATTLEARR